MSAAGFEFDALDFDEVAWTEDWTEPSLEALVQIPGPEPAQWYRLRSGLLSNEVPLLANLGLKKAEALEEKLGLVRAPAATTAARRSIISNVLYAHAQSSAIWVFYSRDQNYYATASQTRRYFPAHYTYDTMMAAVQSLEENGSYRALEDGALADGLASLQATRQPTASGSAQELSPGVSLKPARGHHPA